MVFNAFRYLYRACHELKAVDSSESFRLACGPCEEQESGESSHGESARVLLFLSFWTRMICMFRSAVSMQVYSKTYCPYCSQVKSLFTKLNIPAKVVELDQLEDGDDVQSALQEVSGMRTVPQVFVGGKLVGGCDGVLRKESVVVLE